MTSSHTTIALTPFVIELAALEELVDTNPHRARATFREALHAITPAEWALLGLIHRSFAHSPKSALARVVSIASARLGTPEVDDSDRTDTDSRASLYALADAAEIPAEVELGPWVRTPVRELADEPRMHAIPTAATDAIRMIPDALARRRARHAPRPVAAVVLRHRARDERSAARRRRAEAEADAYFADRPLLVA
ncbi:hypothetical protein OH799_11265 [Nocardia sp. NBC_00881]|uniref:hypothetical protein n=1 Tax=Nocardia sp. NBC_00881 TaxID=2975995 RepID=UPI003868795C|nr:hypothetical protein OH799_11265 [Nocardia sp. NBC_00881]